VPSSVVPVSMYDYSFSSSSGTRIIAPVQVLDFHLLIDSSSYGAITWCITVPIPVLGP